MTRFLIVLIAFFASYGTILAQKQLSVERKADQVYPCENRKEMMALFKCSKDLKLTFSSNYHAGSNVDILSETIDTVGTECEYRLVFPTELKGAMSLNKRKLTIYCQGFDPVVLTMFNSDPKTCRVYEIVDPYLKLQTPFYIALSEATELFDNGNYADAIAKYQIAKETPEYSQNKDNKSLIDSRMALSDSLITWRERADNALRGIKYVEAMTWYSKILKYNPNDVYVIEKNRDCATAHASDCNSFYSTAEDMYDAGDLMEARFYYQKVIDSDCAFKAIANDKLLMVDKILESKKNKDHFFTYEWHKDVPIAFTVGSAKFRKWGGYFSLHTNVDAIELMRLEPKKTQMPEANVSVGWTHKIVAPIWIHFGPGYTGIGEYHLRQSGVEKDKNGEPLENKDVSFNWYSAISPEVGLMFKMWHVNVRYTFQYRFALKSKYEEIISPMRHYVGIGFAW